MSLDFLNTPCRERPRTSSLFGLCDDQDGTKAYSDMKNRTKWVVAVRNPKMVEIVFTAIDKCIIMDNEFHDLKRCDGMLTTNEHLFFVELKSKRTDWIQDAIEQIESTIQLFMENHKDTFYRYKKAYICNKKHPHFHQINHETSLSFFSKYGFRIDIQAEIVFK